MQLWHVAQHGKRRGPLAPEAISELATCGEITRGALVWREGMAAWEPIAAHFDLPPLAATPDDGRAMPEPTLGATLGPPDARLPDSPEHLGAKRRRRALLLRGLAATAGAMTFGIGFARFPFHKSADPVLAAGSYAALILLGSLCAGSAARDWWKLTGEAFARASAAGGAIKAVCAVSALAWLTFAFIFAAQTSLIYRVSVARVGFDRYTVEVHVESQEIAIQGLIGPGIADKVSGLLDTYSSVNAISISSPGGLVDEALGLARAIQARNLTVFARKECNSACVIVLLSGAERFADYDMDIGFHATSPITSLKAHGAVAGYEETASDVDAYLISRGVPPGVVQAANALGPGGMKLVHAIDLADVSVLTGVLDGRSQISLPVAKWLWVERAVGRSQETRGAAAVLQAVRLYAPDLVDSRADTLFYPLERNDLPALRSAMSAVIGAVAPAAIEVGDPELALTYLHATLRQILYFSSVEAWKTCSSYVDGKGIANLSDASPAALDEEMRSLSELSRSAGESNWAARPIPSWAEKEGSATILRSLRTGPGAAVDFARIDKDPKTKCLWMARLMAEITSLGAIRGVVVYRWLEAQGQKN